jgi:hypothetical protein
VLGTAGNRANAAILVKHTRATCRAFFRPNTPLLKDTNESRIKSRINRLAAITLGKGLDTCTATQRKNSFIPLYRIGGLLKKNVVTLTFYGQFFNF